MSGPRISAEDLSKILTRKGYGITTSVGKGTIETKIGGSGEIDDVESDSLYESLGAKRVQIRCGEKVRVRITFYRRRLADYSRAISEKALVDCLTKSGIIKGDSENEVWIEDGDQKKVGSDQEERTELELFYPEVDFDNLWEPAKRKDGR